MQVIDLHAGTAHEVAESALPASDPGSCCPECRARLVRSTADGYSCPSGHLLEHDLVVLVAIAELPQPFTLGDCAPFYGESTYDPWERRVVDRGVSPCLQKVIVRLVKAGRLLKIGKRYGVA